LRAKEVPDPGVMLKQAKTAGALQHLPQPVKRKSGERRFGGQRLLIGRQQVCIDDTGEWREAGKERLSMRVEVAMAVLDADHQSFASWPIPRCGSTTCKAKG
jgi:hypothetical protein